MPPGHDLDAGPAELIAAVDQQPQRHGRVVEDGLPPDGCTGAYPCRVSYGTYARKVADGSLPYGQRINALGGCVQLYRPLGYLATFSYLSQSAGSFRRDEAALLRALGMLTASRELWLVEVDAYAARRREAKRLGRRTPRSSDTNPIFPACWYGDSRRAAIFTLGYLLRKAERISHVDADVVRLASSVVGASGHGNRVPLEQLSVLRKRLEQLREASGWPDVDWPNWHKANRSLWVLRQISNATT
ncbi:hypothetical protein SAMN05421748_106109 [Paractinoplanes atraurantiacus]|uniref:Uncharacterized protein n=2 Tax=Paractinoplanes atraurantiacus TaxID=1036182 RepID=A0A285HZ49_9ACTN|nr:hypothetical protein SAMN05421748_106109 [Actinoplanes atraurantiacus]